MRFPPLPPMSLVHQIAAEEAAKVPVTLEEVMGPCRQQHIAWARIRTYKRLHALGYSHSGIAQRMNRDHTTVRSGVLRELRSTPPPKSYGLRQREYSAELAAQKLVQAHSDAHAVFALVMMKRQGHQAHGGRVGDGA
jgi:hypothetical protein